MTIKCKNNQKWQLNVKPNQKRQYNINTNQKSWYFHLQVFLEIENVWSKAQMTDKENVTKNYF